MNETTTNETANGYLTFEQWMRKVDALCSAAIGVGAFDMEDYRWRDDYDDKLSPEDALEGAMEYWSDDPMFADLMDALDW